VLYPTTTMRDLAPGRQGNGGTHGPTTKERLDRMRRTPDDVAAVLRDHPDESLTRRPAEAAWSATEIVCHLRDVEEFYTERVRTILTNDEPVLVVLDPDRWAEERQYRRHDPTEALSAFARRRAETLMLLDGLDAEQWERSGLHRLRGRMSIRRIVHGWAKHDELHLDQLARAVADLP
jgi:DinB superfamily